MKKLCMIACFTFSALFLFAKESDFNEVNSNTQNPSIEELFSQTPKEALEQEDSLNDSNKDLTTQSTQEPTKELVEKPIENPIKEDLSLPITKAPTQTEEKLSPPKENTQKDTSKKDVPQKNTAKKATSQTPKKPSKNPAPKLSEDISKDQNLLKEKSKEKKVTFIQEEFYEPKKNEISLGRKNKSLILNIHSKELQKFMGGGVYSTKKQVQTFALADSFTQITNIDGKIYEYKYAQKSIDRYSTIAPYENYPLKKISTTSYQIVLKKIPPIFDISGCKIAIKKELSGTLNQRQEVIVNLDTKRELRNNSHFDLFLECPR